MRSGMTKTEHVRIHERVYRANGPAYNFKCVDCNSRAAEWSWTHKTDPFNIKNYNPRCKKCHHDYDQFNDTREISVLRLPNRQSLREL